MLQGDEGDRRRFSGWMDLALQTSLTLALSVILLGWVGYTADNWLGTSPWLTVLGFMWGAGGGTAWVVIRVKQFADKQEREEAQRQDGGGQ